MKLILVVKHPWWTKYYLRTLSLFCMTFNTKPDPEKVSKFILKHSSCRVSRERV